MHRGAVDTHGFIRFQESEETEFDEGLNVGKEVKENISRMTPRFLRAGRERVWCPCAGIWVWTS